MHEKISFNGWPGCIRLYNKELELVVTTDVGPRIVGFGFIGKQNFFYLAPEQKGLTGGQDWRIYGGHRLWIAPEEIPRSYGPDNEKIEFTVTGDSIKLRQAPDTFSGIAKEIDISLAPDKNEVVVIHRLINRSSEETTLAPWALSVLVPGGSVIIPQEPFGEGDEYLLPARPVVLWHFTKMNDPRWTWGEKYILTRHLAQESSEQKIGVLNKQRWTAYALGGELLIKTFAFDADALYPDYNSNNETYVNGKFLEMETLGPLCKLSPGGVVEHVEHWFLARASMDGTERSIDENILPLVRSFLAGA